MPVNHAKEYLIFVHTGVVFLHFLARASNGRQYSNIENKCPKFGTGTPEDMVLTNLGDSLDSDPSGFVLLDTYLHQAEQFRSPKVFGTCQCLFKSELRAFLNKFRQFIAHKLPFFLHFASNFT